ncbi:MAG: hypothetical protein LC793_24075 [Thermomicrobia bacterium]|nr:hypothetical protein [Thermomicrobia bacterium]
MADIHTRIGLRFNPLTGEQENAELNPGDPGYDNLVPSAEENQYQAELRAKEDEKVAKKGGADVPSNTGKEQ